MDQFFTKESLLVIGGAAVAVVAVTNTVARLVPRAPSNWVAFGASCIVVALGLFVAKAVGAVELSIACRSVCVLFCTALGINTAAGSAGQVAAAPKTVRTGESLPAEERPSYRTTTEYLFPRWEWRGRA